MRSRKNMVALMLMLVLVAQNIVVLLAGFSLTVSNIACIGAFVFFTMSLSPGSLLGFALTIRDWGDVFRREMQGQYDPHGSEFGRGATRSLTVLSIFVLLGFGMACVRSGGGTPATDMALLIGMEAGFVAGYLVATRHRFRFHRDSQASSRPVNKNT